MSKAEPQSPERESCIPAEVECRVCRQPIPANRLQALPGATLCISCTTKRGDVLRIKRFDEFAGEERYETYFTRDTYIEELISRQLGTPVKFGIDDADLDLTGHMKWPTRAPMVHDHVGNVYNIQGE